MYSELELKRSSRFVRMNKVSFEVFVYTKLHMSSLIYLVGPMYNLRGFITTLNSPICDPPLLNHSLDLQHIHTGDNLSMGVFIQTKKLNRYFSLDVKLF